ncbi:glutathione S-transferase-like protein [Collybia nuda]|uniref:glutathione transferase n=1 Tax=Collybia nuda TaxID=64659 RepID=A0A9P5Y265_9AGAR|nr:glutathione S-transferase-like protein [Collybia nuda]
MVLKLYGSSQSTCTRRVGTVLLEKKIPFELVEVDLMKGQHKEPSYLEKQPFGQIPYIDDDGFILYESRAICRYLAAKHRDQGINLLPAGAKENALFEQAASIELNNFEPYANKAVAEIIFKPYWGQTPDKDVFNKLIEQLSAKLDAYDVILGKQKYLAGNEITLADLFHIPYGSMLIAAGSDIMTQKPNVTRWWNDLLSRPSWQAVKDGNFTVKA